MRTITTTVLACVAALAASAPAHAQTHSQELRAVARVLAGTPRAAMYQRGGEEAIDRQTRTIKIGKEGVLDISNLSGDITISRGSGTDLQIEFVKRARGQSTEEAKELLALVQVRIVERGGRVEVRSDYPHKTLTKGKRQNMNVSVAFTITGPGDMSVTAKSFSGNLKTTDIKGEVALETLSGNVTIAGAGRIASAKSMSGNVTITDTRVESGIEANSMSGTVTLRNARARRLDIGSVSGDIVVQEVECEAADLHSFSGNIEYSGAFARGGRYEMTSHSGDVRLALSGKTGFEVEATTFNGALRSDLQLKDQGTQEVSDRRRRRSMQGVFGDGSAMLEITTFSGDVLISKK